MDQKLPVVISWTYARRESSRQGWNCTIRAARTATFAPSGRKFPTDNCAHFATAEVFSGECAVLALKAHPTLDDPARVSSRRQRSLSIFSRSLCPFAAAATLCWSPGANAAPRAESMRASANADGYLSTESSQVLPAWTPSAALVTGWGRFGGSSDITNRWSIDSRMTTHVLAGIGLFNHAQLDLDLPMVVHQTGSAIQGQSTLEPAAFGDLRVSAKGTILHARRRGLGVGAGMDLYLPTGSESALSSMGGVAVAFSAMAEYRAYRGFSGALNLGYLARPDRDDAHNPIGDLLTYRLAGRAPFGPHSQFSAIVELDGGIHLKAGARSPLVARAGLDWAFESGVRLGVFGGGGLSTRLGTPNVQALFRVAYIPPSRLGKERAFVGAPRPGAREMVRRKDRLKAIARAPERRQATPEDPDADGLLASADRCPNVAEDLDRFADEDGCPEFDNDRDGFADGLDLCPNEPEINNGFADKDGCPDVILNGKGSTVATVAEAKFFPEVKWIGPSDKLTKESKDQLGRFVELVLLNPWLAPVEIRVDGPSHAKLAKFDHLDPDDIALRRAQRLAKWFADHKLDPWRVFVAPKRAAQPDSVEFVIHQAKPSQGTRLGGLAPIAATPSLMEAKFMEVKSQEKAPKLYHAQGPEGAASGPDAQPGDAAKAAAKPGELGAATDPKAKAAPESKSADKVQKDQRSSSKSAPTKRKN